MNPIRFLKNIFVDILLNLTGTWIGAPRDKPWSDTPHWKEE
ncbi:MAG: hypothetical protein NXH78_07285 [Hyphomonadaceae bacterium]|nr:hypothetical protein [Hyphomonadaceae bacterium]